MELWITCFIGLFSLVSTIISSKGALYDNRFRWYRRLNKRGIAVLALGVLIISLSSIQIFLFARNERNKDKLEKIEQFKRDSTISSEVRKGIDLNRRQLFDDLSTALAKQNLKIDTVSKELKKISDSVSKKIIVTVPNDMPILIIRKGGIRHKYIEDTLFLEFDIVATQAAARISDLYYTIETTFSDGSIARFSWENLLKDTLTIPKDQPFSSPFTLENSRKVKSIRIGLIGDYTNVDNTGKYNLRDLYKYDLATKEIGFILGEEKKQFFQQAIPK